MQCNDIAMVLINGWQWSFEEEKTTTLLKILSHQPTTKKLAN